MFRKKRKVLFVGSHLGLTRAALAALGEELRIAVVIVEMDEPFVVVEV